jgi:hypothetical protein
MPRAPTVRRKDIPGWLLGLVILAGIAIALI